MKKHVIKNVGLYYTTQTGPKMWSPVQRRARKFNIKADAAELARHFPGSRVVGVRP